MQLVKYILFFKKLINFNLVFAAGFHYVVLIGLTFGYVDAVELPVILLPLFFKHQDHCYVYASQ